MPKAYWVATYRSVNSPDKLAAYAKLAGPAIQAAGGKFLARGNAAKAYEVRPRATRRHHRVRQRRRRHQGARRAGLSGGAARLRWCS